MKLLLLWWTCPYRAYLGIECYGCGAQTALMLLLEGKITESFHTYPALLSLLPLFILLVVSFLDKKRKYRPAILSLTIVNILVILVSYYFF